MTLEIQNVTSGYVKEVPVLRDVNLIAREGALTGIIGPNGAGKSTLLNTIYGYLRPTGGDVLHHGKSITGLNSVDPLLTRVAISLAVRASCQISKAAPLRAGDS